MRAIILSWEYPPRSVGGIASHVYDLTNEMSRKGLFVSIITCQEGNLPEFEARDNIHIHRVLPYQVHTYNITQWVYNLNTAMMEKCVHIIEQEGPFDIVHAHDWMVAFVARFLKNAYHIPLISTIHATEYGRNNGLHDDMQRYISNIEWWLTYESWKVICCSKYMENQLTSFFQLPKDKIRVIYNGVDPERFASETVDNNFKQQYATLNEKIVFFIGRHVHEKGVHILLESIPIVLNQYNDVKFIIAGRGPNTDYLKHRVVELGVQDRVYFTGYIDDHIRNKLYRISDVTVFPSLYEPFGIVALEGMAAKVPVIASDTGGLREIINQGVDGYKFECGNPWSLSDYIIKLLQNPKICKQFSQNGFDKVLHHFSWDDISKQTMQVYEKVISEYKTDVPVQTGKRTEDSKERMIQ